MAMRRVAKVDITLGGKVRTFAIHLCASFTNLASFFQHIKAREGISAPTSPRTGMRTSSLIQTPSTCAVSVDPKRLLGMAGVLIVASPSGSLVRSLKLSSVNPYFLSSQVGAVR